jgi:hypothetical protein
MNPDMTVVDEEMERVLILLKKMLGREVALCLGRHKKPWSGCSDGKEPERSS